MLGVKSQLDKIIAEKNSAFKVLIATKDKLVASCKKAQKFTEKNLNEINQKKQEIIAKKEMNLALQLQVLHMEASISETDRIVNPVIEGASDGEADRPRDDGKAA